MRADFMTKQFHVPTTSGRSFLFLLKYSTVPINDKRHTVIELPSGILQLLVSKHSCDIHGCAQNEFGRDILPDGVIHF